MAKGMDFYEMSLLQTELKLDDRHEQISAVNKSKKLIGDELIQKLRDEKELSAKAKKFKKILCSHCNYTDYPEYSPAKYGLVPTTPNKVPKDEVTTSHKVVNDDVVDNKIYDKDETIPDSKGDDKDEFDDIDFEEALELCDKPTHDKNDKDENDKANELTDDNEKYDNDDKDGNDKNKLTNNVSDKEVTHDSKDKNANNDVMTDMLNKQCKDGDNFGNDSKDKGIRTDTMTDKKVKHKKYTGLDTELNCIKKKKLKSDDRNAPFSTFKKNVNF